MSKARSIKKRVLPVATVVIAVLIVGWVFATQTVRVKPAPIGMAVEFNDHAAAAYVAKEKGFFKAYGLNVTSFESYVTGVELAAALARGDIQVGWICSGPAVLAYARGVPVRIVAGTHLYGYALVARDNIHDVRELEKKLIGCVREGSNADLLLHILAERYSLNIDFTRNVRYANPPKLITLLKTGAIDAAFIPEHHATIAESLGFKILVLSQDLWPSMQGSVLVVKRELIEQSPDTVRKIVELTYKATSLINENREEAAEIVSAALRGNVPADVPWEIIGPQLELTTPQVIEKSMGRLEYTCNVNVEAIQRCADLLLRLGYIEQPIKADDMLDLRFLSEVKGA